MTFHSKIFIDERTPYNLTIAPLYKYCQAISLWSRRFAQKNSLVIETKDKCDYIFCHSGAVKDHVLSGKRVIAYCTNIKHYDRASTDQSNVTLVDFTGECEYTRLKYVRMDASFPIADIQGIIPEQEQKSRLPIFNLTVFVRDMSDIEKIISFWLDKRFKGSLYLFKSVINDIDMNCIELINSLNDKIKGRKISLFNYDNDIGRVVSAIKSSPISIFFERELVFIFWSIYLKSYPIIFQDEIISQRFTHLDSEDKVEQLLQSFLEYPRELQNLMSRMSSFRFSQVDIFYEILAKGVI